MTKKTKKSKELIQEYISHELKGLRISQERTSEYTSWFFLHGKNVMIHYRDRSRLTIDFNIISNIKGMFGLSTHDAEMRIAKWIKNRYSISNFLLVDGGNFI